MAIIAPVITNPDPGGDCVLVTWTALANGDSGTPVSYPGFADVSFQVTGTFGIAGNLRIEGSNDSANYAALTDPQGNALDFIATKIEQVEEVVLRYRPRATAGDGTTALTTTAFFRRTTR